MCLIVSGAACEQVCDGSGSGELSAHSPATDHPSVLTARWGQLALPVAGVGWEVFHTDVTPKPGKALEVSWAPPGSGLLRQQVGSRQVSTTLLGEWI